MKHKWKKVAVSCLTTMALVATLCLACGGGGGEETTTIVIGNLTDLSGVAAPALTPMTWALEDVVKDLNARQVVPGVKLKVVSYDTAYNPAKFIPGYEWLKQQGAHVIVSVFNDCSETLKPLAATDKVAILCMATSLSMVSPPGWVFAFSAPASWSVRLMLKWVIDHWDYTAEGRNPKIACVGWNDGFGTEQAQGTVAYCTAHSDKIAYVGTYLAPVGTMTWSGEAAQTKDCDYVCLCATGALQPATFAKEYREKGGTGIFISTEGASAYVGYIVDYAGWAAIDGSMNVQSWAWWNLTQWSEVQYIRDLLSTYHPADAESVIHAGMGYLGGAAMQRFAMDTVLAAIERVGAQNFDGQAYYDTAVNYTATWAGDQRGFTADRRNAVNDFIVLKWSAADKDLKLISGGWLPIPQS
ncbi:MAG: ABC transporter substrate-binding protein [Chloroflexi bacterium]|nr:ABC transporter substrate-binding protein [Chloroflexota bacterium]